MTPVVYRQGWTPDEVAWDKFDPAKAPPWLVDAIKSAALIEFNAPDYVGYLKRIFPEDLAEIEQWGREESQHGRVLGRWAEMADPSFKLEEAFARFRAGYRPPHLGGNESESVRGSRRGEIIARCVVESGTSSYYTAIKDATDEPVLKEIAGRIAADEYRHYKMFYAWQKKQSDPELPLWRRLAVAFGRVAESDDDESAYAYYCATVPADQAAAKPYNRAAASRRVFSVLTLIYRRGHIQKLTQMVVKAAGANPQGWLAKIASAAVWRMLQIRSIGATF
jgi:hypothetical protein